MTSPSRIRQLSDQCVRIRVCQSVSLTGILTSMSVRCVPVWPETMVRGINFFPTISISLSLDLSLSFALCRSLCLFLSLSVSLYPTLCFRLSISFNFLHLSFNISSEYLLLGVLVLFLHHTLCLSLSSAPLSVFLSFLLLLLFLSLPLSIFLFLSLFLCPRLCGF